MIINKTTKQVISNQEKFCKNILSQAIGLMFHKKQNLVMTFPKERKISLHMFFVSFPIDVLILDKDYRVIEIKENFKPYSFWKSKKKGKYLVELGFRNDNVKVDDVLELE
jgi:uncharacterized protein